MEHLLGLPPEASMHAPQIDHMLGMVHWLMVILFVGWGAFFVYTLVRFRAPRQHRADYAGVKSHASNYVEIGVAAFEAFLLIGFAIPIWSSVVTAFPSERDATVVHVVAEQFAWNIHYPGPDGVFGRTDISLISAENPLGLDRSDPAAKDDITTINQLNLPVGKPVIVYLTSKDVIHSFGLPYLRVKQDAIPGQRIPLWFVPTKTSAEVSDELTRRYSIRGGHYPGELSYLVAKTDYNGKDGTVIVSKGSPVTEDLIPQLNAAEVTEILAGPDTPIEIACAQLCGLGHYRMRGFVNIQTEKEYRAWLSEQASYLTQ
jgi:cytochrome c oxidase subunit 2